MNAEGLPRLDVTPMQATTPTILVAEDEVLIRMDVVEQLEAQGYEVIEACNAHEALDALTGAAHVDLLFTDVNMPGDLDGIALAHEVSRRWPKAGIIVTSGKKTIAPDQLPGQTRFYSKPYMADTIHTAIREMLDIPG